MAELSKRAQALIDAARGADDPAPEARERADAAVRVALAMHGVTDLPKLAAPQSRPDAHADVATAGPSTHVALGLKLGLGAALLSAILLGVFTAQRAPAPQHAPATRDVRGPESAPAEPVARPPEAALPERRAADLEVGDAPARARQRARGAAAASSAALEAEVRLIAAADGLVRSDRFAEALRLLEQHARRFPRGALREERSALRVLSLCGTGAVDAQAQGERFLSRSPSSVLAQRVRAACAAEGTP